MSKGVNVIFVIVYRLSKHGHFLTLKHSFNAANVVQVFILEVIRLHGIPKSIISDSDKIFSSSFRKECAKASGTKCMFSTTFHPQSVG